jgi:hypothetical protein
MQLCINIRKVSTLCAHRVHAGMGLSAASVTPVRRAGDQLHRDGCPDAVPINGGSYPLASGPDFVKCPFEMFAGQPITYVAPSLCPWHVSQVAVGQGGLLQQIVAMATNMTTVCFIAKHVVGITKPPAA